MTILESINHAIIAELNDTQFHLRRLEQLTQAARRKQIPRMRYRFLVGEMEERFRRYAEECTAVADACRSYVRDTVEEHERVKDSVWEQE